MASVAGTQGRVVGMTVKDGHSGKYRKYVKGRSMGRRMNVRVYISMIYDLTTELNID